MPNKWSGLSSQEYDIEDLGRPAIFLLPVKKITKKVNGQTIRKTLHQFLIKNFGAYTTSSIPSFGFWRDASQDTVTDACIKYEVSFLGKEKIPLLFKQLAQIAYAIKEK